MTAAVLDLSVGASPVLDGDEWRVERREPHAGRVHLVGHDGGRQCLTFRYLANHPVAGLRHEPLLPEPGGDGSPRASAI